MEHRPTFARMKSTGAIILKHPCCKCGEAWAPFGEAVNLRAALKALEGGIEHYGRHLGRWWCGGFGKCKREAATQGALL